MSFFIETVIPLSIQIRRAQKSYIKSRFYIRFRKTLNDKEVLKVFKILYGSLMGTIFLFIQCQIYNRALVAQYQDAHGLKANTFRKKNSSKCPGSKVYIDVSNFYIFIKYRDLVNKTTEH